LDPAKGRSLFRRDLLWVSWLTFTPGIIDKGRARYLIFTTQLLLPKEFKIIFTVLSVENV